MPQRAWLRRSTSLLFLDPSLPSHYLSLTFHCATAAGMVAAEYSALRFELNGVGLRTILHHDGPDRPEGPSGSAFIMEVRVAAPCSVYGPGRVLYLVRVCGLCVCLWIEAHEHEWCAALGSRWRWLALVGGGWR